MSSVHTPNLTISNVWRSSSDSWLFVEIDFSILWLQHLIFHINDVTPPSFNLIRMNQLIDMLLSGRRPLKWRRRWLIPHSSFASARWHEVEEGWEISQQSSWKWSRRWVRYVPFCWWMTLWETWLCAVLWWRLELSGKEKKTTGAYLLLSAGLSTAHLQHRWEINAEPSVHCRCNKWPIQARTYSTPEENTHTSAQKKWVWTPH